MRLSHIVVALGICLSPTGLFANPLHDTINVYNKRFGGNIFQIESGLNFTKRLNDFAELPNSSEYNDLVIAYGCLVNTFKSKSDINFVYRQTIKIVGDFGGLKDKLDQDYDSFILDFVTGRKRQIANNSNQGYVSTSFLRPSLCPAVSKDKLSESEYIERLKGIDLNGNGVRDDIDHKIAKDLSKYPGLRQIALNIARAYQDLMLVDYRNKSELRDAMWLVLHASYCLTDLERQEFKYALSPLGLFNRVAPVNDVLGYATNLRNAIFDSNERKIAYELIDYGVDDAVFSLPNSQSCSYYLNNIKDAKI